MKTKKIFICMLAFFLLTFACKKENLDTTSTRQLATIYYNYDDHIANVINGAYAPLQAENNNWGTNPWMWGSVASDDAWAGGGSNTDQVGYQTTNLHTITQSDPANLLNLWKFYFQGINRCNLILTYVKPDNDLKKDAIGQAQFLCGMYYFYLARMFGGLPLMPKVPIPTDIIKRSSLDQTYTFIEDLLTKAVNSSMQERKGGVDPSNGFATKASAQALLGKVYMYHAAYIDETGAKVVNKQYYTSAITYLKAVADDSTNYRLDPEFWHIFNPDTRHGIESIFEVNFTTILANGTQGNALSTLCGPRTVANQIINDTINYGWGFNAPNKALVNLFNTENDVVRYNATIFDTASLQKWHDKGRAKSDRLNWDNSKDGYYDRKHYSNPHDYATTFATNSNPMILLRLGDIYLLLAEAYNQTGDDVNALIWLNKVRARVNRPPLSSSGATLYQNIKDERHLELALEGDRYFDLVRWGDASAVLLGNTSAGIFSYDEGTPGKKTYGLFPIPDLEITRTTGSNALTQNPGY